MSEGLLGPPCHLSKPPLVSHRRRQCWPEGRGIPTPGRVHHHGVEFKLKRYSSTALENKFFLFPSFHIS